MRLNKFIASTGFCSRRKADELIKSGKVRINGEPATLGHQVDPQTDQISVHGKTIATPAKFTYIMLHKPTGYITTKADLQDDQTIYALLPQKHHHLHPVGRLDRESEGLLLLTDDGDFTYQMTHPSNDSEKIYQVKIKNPLNPNQIQKIESGIIIEEKKGPYKTRPCEIKSIGVNRFEITLHEGRNRQIRKMFKAAGSSVVFLKRIKMGKHELGKLKKGDWKNV
ncbi:rRNA pseudouridine synthase [Candidatus Peregrinibacteria bacterium]|jgi:23S rRNA pseudouridine2605 synthase|nr:rRNA pseudouridine synthase [Candidatus Peregrinibacteria bacterium]MBT7483872.1 rRNA pseudouridine synthase [Candidatus Peregrinibacteria bacterium]MBT7702687.1 rRNA pseudouridine synthase [Candidatus Peregrinibacteria bacterium]